MDLAAIPTVTAGNGFALPAVGFGTYALKGAEGVEALGAALRHGYRLFDSAFNYENEGTVGAALRAGDVPRDDVIVTSKLPGRHHAYDAALATIAESVYRTGLDYLDLYLIHWPNPRQNTFLEAWNALIEARERGLVRHIGVCNFLPEHIDVLTESTGVTPEVNQIELHPYFPQDEQRAYDRASGIITESWSPLGRKSDLLQNPVITALAETYGVQPAQVVLRWHTQLGVVPIPKSGTPERQQANLDVFGFTLTDDDLRAVAGLARPDGRLAGQDPAVYEEF